MKLHLDPPVDEWCTRLTQWLGRADRPVDAPIRIATGHQPWFWHPGILAKYMMTSAVADAVGGVSIDVVVDQDTVASLAVECPVVSDGRIRIDSFDPIKCDPDIPLGMQGALPLSTSQPLAGSNIEVLAEASSSSKPAADDSLADQVHAVNAKMMADLGVTMQQSIRATELLADDAGRAIVDAMLGDALNCVQSYNAAVEAVPAAGMTRLIVARDRVELPLWALRGGEPRRRVFADMADSIPCLTLEDGSELSPSDLLAPRALLLTAVMRSLHCDLFIHGLGGGIYDAITEAWWKTWRGETLAPAVVVSASVMLEFEGVAVADRSDFERTVWFAHHLPHNIDRYLPDDSGANSLRQQKAILLVKMDGQHDRKERSKLFRSLHDINDQLVNEHTSLIQSAQQEVDRTRIGMENRKQLQRRDWCFALYPSTALGELKSQVERCIESAIDAASFGQKT